MSPTPLQPTSSDLFAPSSSFENALATLDLPPGPADAPETSKRRVTFRETPEIGIFPEGGEDEEDARERKRRKLDDDAPEGQEEDLVDINNEDRDEESDDYDTITEADRLAYLDDKAYSASSFGGIRSYLRNRRVKLQNQNQDIANARGEVKPQIFKGLEIYINGYVQPSLQQMKELIMEHGGIYHPFLDRKKMVTHIIASTLTPSKHLEFRTYRVATPQWLLASVAAGELKDWRDFKLVAEGGEEDRGRKGLGGWLGSQAVEGKGKGRELEEGGGEMGRGRKRSDVGDGSSSSGAGLVVRSEVVTRQTLLKPRVLPSAPVTPARAFPHTEAPPSSPRPSKPIPFEHPTTPTHFTKPTAHVSPSTTSPVAASTPIPPSSVFAPLKARSPTHTSDPATFAAYQRSGYALAQEHPAAKRLMKSEEWRVGNTAVGEGFIEGFYQNSRLHMLSMWKAELKVLVAKAQDQSESPDLLKTLAPGVQDLSHSLSTSVLPRPSPRKATASASSSNKIILHVDFDAFFVSCGLSTRPELRGKPTVVCHSQGKQGSLGSTSEVASCSYEAREKGVKNGMSLGQARSLCPEVQTIPYEFETYKSNSLAFYTILMAYADELQAISVDEAILDVTTQVAALAAAPDSGEREEDVDMDVGAELDAAGEEGGGGKDWAVVLAERIRGDVRAATSCEVSIGIAHNLLLARLATRKAKPAGVFHIKPFNAQSFISHLDIGDLPGFGYATRDKINDLFGTTSCGDLFKHSKNLLRAKLGKTGETLWGYLRGADEKTLEPHKERKSVSAEVNYGIRFLSTEEAEEFLINLSKEVSKRMQAVQRKGKQVTLKVMVRHPNAPIETPKFMGHGVCIPHNKAGPLGKNGKSTDDPEQIAEAILKIYRSFKFVPADLRGIGIQVQKLDGGDDLMVESGQSVLGFSKRVPPIAEPDSGPVPGPSTISLDSSLPEPDIEAAPSGQVPSIRAAVQGPSSPPFVASSSEPGVMHPSEMDQFVWEYLGQGGRNDMRMKWRKAKLSIPKSLLLEPPGASLVAESSTNKKRDRSRTRSESAGPSKKGSRTGQQTLKGFMARSRTPMLEEPIDVDDDVVEIKPEPEAGVAADVAKPSKARTALIKKGRVLGIAESYLEELPMDLLEDTIANETTRLALHIPKPPNRHSRSPEKPIPVSAIPIDKALRPLIKGQAVSLEDILANIEDLASREDSPDERRNKRSVAKLQDYLLACMDRSKGGVGGVEDVATALAWWKICLKRKWVAGGEVGDAQRERAKEWQAVFRGVREEIDRVAVERFGGPLAIS